MAFEHLKTNTTEAEPLYTIERFIDGLQVPIEGYTLSLEDIPGLEGVAAEITVNQDQLFSILHDKDEVRVVTTDNETWMPLLQNGGSLMLGGSKEGSGALLSRNEQGDVSIRPFSPEDQIHLIGSVIEKG
jgi:hypothetical protein